MKIRLLTGAAIALVMSSCSTISHTAKTEDVDTRIYNLTVADMKVNEQRVSKTTEWKWNPIASVSIEKQKTTATAELLKETDADVLVEPQYTVHRRGLFRGGSLTVSGYPAKYANFHAMTPAEAEAVATLDGKAACAYPIINTSATRKVKKQKPVVKSDAGERVSSRHTFLSVIGGAVIDVEDCFDAGEQFGLMFGSHGRRWGWYTKILWNHAKGEEYHYWSGYNSRSLNGGMLTVGAIKTLPANFNMFLGVGIGSGFSEGYDGDVSFDSYLSMPVELGFQWHRGSFNVVAGVTAATMFDDYAESKFNINPFVGVGFSF